MKCPIDEIELTMTDRSGVEIDYCPKCRGVWLDRGELDKIIERSEGAQPQMPEPDRQPYMQAPQQPYPTGQYGHGNYGKHGRRRKSVLGELFDF